MSIKAFEDLKDMLCDAVEEYSKKNELTGKDVEAIHVLTDTIKNIDKIMIMDESGEYSQAGNWEAMGRGHFGDYSRNYDEGGNSYRGRKRDSMGRYSRARGRRDYSRNGGDDMMEHIDMMMEEAETPQEREMIKRFKKELERI